VAGKIVPRKPDKGSTGGASQRVAYLKQQLVTAKQA
jgi:hypothetical protein